MAGPENRRFLQRACKGKIWPIVHAFVLLVLCLVESSRASATELRLSWIDNSFNEDGFEIERKIGTNGEFVRIATVEANQSFYADADIIPAATYCYRVRAFNRVGASQYSNESCATLSSLMGTLENPEYGQPVAGVATVHGWGFDTRVGGIVERVTLLIDGVPVGEIPCCSARLDVRNAFPQFPAANTEQSGWGAVVNWGLLSAGSHTVQVRLTSAAGEIHTLPPHTVSVVNAGDFPFLEQFSLAQATADIVEDALVVRGVLVQDKASGRRRQVDVRFRWFPNAQAFSLVDAVTRAEASVAQPFSAESFPTERVTPEPAAVSVAGQSVAGIVAAFESPEEARAVAGVGLARGWVFAEEPLVTVEEVRLFIDGVEKGVIPCCSPRLDVFRAYQEFANALNSGWGITLNYGLLSPGFHMLETRIRASSGETVTLSRGVTAVRIGGFAFLDQFDLSQATAQVLDGASIAVENVSVRDKASGQTARVDVFLQWEQSTQALGVVASQLSSALSSERH